MGFCDFPPVRIHDYQQSKTNDLHQGRKQKTNKQTILHTILMLSVMLINGNELS